MRAAPQLGLSLRQQLAVLRRHHRRPSFGNFDRLFWVVARCLWSGWRQLLILVAPETVVRWHRAGFRLNWKLVSKARGPIGRRPASQEVRDLIFRMVATLSGRKSSAITARHVSTCHRLTHYSKSDIPESGISNYDHETRYKPIRSLIARRIPYPARACRRRTSWLRNHAGDSSAVGGKITNLFHHALRQPATTDGTQTDSVSREPIW